MYIVCSVYHIWRCHQFQKMEKSEVLDATLVLVIFQYIKLVQVRLVENVPVSQENFPVSPAVH